jgi:hypothetical protein
MSPTPAFVMIRTEPLDPERANRARASHTDPDGTDWWLVDLSLAATYLDTAHAQERTVYVGTLDNDSDTVRVWCVANRQLDLFASAK